MIPVIIGAVIGAVLVGRTKPNAKHLKRELMGSRSGILYKADEFPELGLLFIRFVGVQGKAKAVFTREPGRPGWVFYRAVGDPRVVGVMQVDFQGFLPAEGESA